MPTEQLQKLELCTPGSDAAIEHGCTCPVMDNMHGEGWVVDGLRQWWIAQDCPIHVWKEDSDADRKCLEEE